MEILEKEVSVMNALRPHPTTTGRTNTAGAALRAAAPPRIQGALTMKIELTIRTLLPLIAAGLMLGVHPETSRAQAPSEEIDKLVAPDGQESDFFGVSVDIDGDVAVVGAAGDDDNGINSGSAYVFWRDDHGTPGILTDDSWNFEYKLLAPDGARNDSFGWSVAVSGNVIVVGAPGDSDAGNMTGSAYVFREDNRGTPDYHGDDLWYLDVKLLKPSMAGADSFGWSVAISGETIVVGAPGDDIAANGAGAAWVFTGPIWTATSLLTAADANAFDEFGTAVAIDGDAIVVGAPYHDHVAPDCGAAYVFRGPEWFQEDELLPPGGEENDSFGMSVDVSNDTALVGAAYHVEGDQGYESGAAYVFRYDVNTGGWPPEAILVEWDGWGGHGQHDFFGLSVAVYAHDDHVGVCGDGVLIGAPGDADDGITSGAAYVFRRDDNGTPNNPGDDFWLGVKKLHSSDRDSGDEFGHAVALSSDTGLIGASADSDIAWLGGSAYAFVPCVADLDCDGDTDQGDLGILLSDWRCTGGNCIGDLDGDGDTDQGDLGILLSNWGCGTGS